MKTQKLFFAGSCLLVLAACAPDRLPYQTSDTGARIANSYGDCNRNIVDDYNKILDANLSYSANPQNGSNYADLVQACGQFKAEMGSSTCRAQNHMSGQSVQTGYNSDIRDTCEAVLNN